MDSEPPGNRGGSMLRLPLSQARPGMRLAAPILHPRRQDCVLLAADFALDGPSLRRLEEMKRGHVWVRCAGARSVERFVNADVWQARAVLAAAAGRVLSAVGGDPPAAPDTRLFDMAMNRLLEAVLAQPAAAVLVEESPGRIAESRRHAAETCFLSTLLGLRLQSYMLRQRRHVSPRDATNLRSLALGAMLHDIGMTRLSAETVERWQNDRDETDAEWRRHVHIGHDLVVRQVDSGATAAVMQHHQYFDGSGFPTKAGWDGQSGGLQAEAIHVFARIVAVADHVDELRHRADGTRWPMVRVLGQMCGRLAERFDPIILRTLLAVVPAYAPGSAVTLSDGRKGFVIDWDTAAPCRPRVVIVEAGAVGRDDGGESGSAGSYEVDLASVHGLSVVECEGERTESDNFVLPTKLEDSARGMLGGAAPAIAPPEVEDLSAA